MYGMYCRDTHNKHTIIKSLLLAYLDRVDPICDALCEDMASSKTDTFKI